MAIGIIIAGLFPRTSAHDKNETIFLPDRSGRPIEILRLIGVVLNPIRAFTKHVPFSATGKAGSGWKALVPGPTSKAVKAEMSVRVRKVEAFQRTS
jgi:hypothetical protein